MGLRIIGFYVADLFGLLSSAFYGLHRFSSAYSITLTIETGTDLSSECLAFPDDCLSAEYLPPNTETSGDWCLCDNRDLTRSPCRQTNSKSCVVQKLRWS